MEITRKMSAATINAVRKGFKAGKSLEFVARLFGIVESAIREATATGAEQWKFVGEFQGVNADGKEFGAPVVYLPAVADDQLAAALKAAEGKAVKFAYDIFVEPAANSLGYLVRVKPLIEPAPINTLVDLGASLPTVTLTKNQPDLATQGATSETAPAGDQSQDPAPTPAPAKSAKSAKK